MICFIADVGQGEDLSGLEGKAHKSGASRLIIRDLREEFAGEYLFPLLRSGAMYERKYLLGTSVACPLIARHLVEVAHATGADAAAHSATGKGNDQYPMSTSLESAPDEPAIVEIEFASGTPVAVNGERMSPARLIAHLNALGGTHGVGRADLVENRLVGMKSHGVYETPGGTILLAAHREVESLVLDRETLQFKDLVAPKYAELVYNGLWFAPLREALNAFVDSTQGPVSGVARLKLYKGNVIPVGRKSKLSLYREDFATFGLEDVYDQSDAEGFIHLYGLSLKVRALNGLPVSGMNMPKPDYSRFKRD